MTDPTDVLARLARMANYFRQNDGKSEVHIPAAVLRGFASTIDAGVKEIWNLRGNTPAHTCLTEGEDDYWCAACDIAEGRQRASQGEGRG
jgi:hypothetical protein